MPCAVQPIILFNLSNKGARILITKEFQDYFFSLE